MTQNMPEVEPLIAAAGWGGPPPAEWFDNPQLDRPTRLTVTDDGRVFGHIAEWDSCHVGYEECTPPPRSPSNYAYFHNGVMRVKSPNGVDRIPVGKITAASGHAHRFASADETLAHYDNTGTVATYVRAGEDAHGIWVAGVTAPGITEEQLVTLEAHPPSGDWRDLGQGLDLVAVLCVNANGYHVALAASGVVEGRTVSLVAAGRLVEDAPVTAEPEYVPGPEIEYVRRLMRADEAAQLAARVTTARVRGKVDGFAAKRRKERSSRALSLQKR